MPLLRPLDPSFPIERQIAIEAGPVVLVKKLGWQPTGPGLIADLEELHVS